MLPLEHQVSYNPPDPPRFTRRNQSSPHQRHELNTEENNDVFIDDADAKAAIRGNNFYLSERKTVANLENGAQLWAELLSATGGVIAHHKSV